MDTKAIEELSRRVFDPETVWKDVAGKLLDSASSIIFRYDERADFPDGTVLYRSRDGAVAILTEFQKP